MNERWCDLRVGDRIRIVRLPSEWNLPGYHVPPCTKRLYQRLIARRRSVRISEIDELGLPWIRCQFRSRSGGWEYHFLAVNDDSWVRIKSSGKRSGMK
jgi:hypothetical protein